MSLHHFCLDHRRSRPLPHLSSCIIHLLYPYPNATSSAPNERGSPLSSKGPEFRLALPVCHFDCQLECVAGTTPTPTRRARPPRLPSCFVVPCLIHLQSP